MRFFKEPIYLILLFYAVLAAFTIFYFNGTGDSGDSITHYLFAKYAPRHPDLYFHHWAKPVFVLLASPFAQFGFGGMKLFNVLNTLGTIFLTYKIAERLQLKNTYAVALLLIFSPMYFVLTFSGLTEPLFALFLAGAIFLCTKRKYLPAILLVSFMPFVRSEGLIFLGVFGVYLIAKQKWKLIPWLAAGHFVYSFAGYFAHQDLLWVFRKIPYAHFDSIYGRGDMGHFAKELFYILGLPALVLFLFGFVALLKDILKRKKISRLVWIVVFGGFLCFFAAHTIFWYYGIFGSMGLTRVFICVIPLMALIMLKGFNFLTEEIIPDRKNISVVLKVAILFYIVAFPFTRTHGAIVFDRDMTLSVEQKAAEEVGKFLFEQKTETPKIAYEAPHLAIALNIDPFDQRKRTHLNAANLKTLKSGDVLIWDNHFALLDMKINKEELDQDTTFTNVFTIPMSENGREAEYRIYRKK
ncbi:MAG: hypothetical protein M3R17_18010 [Bacteroidota bacterium]|nr:hypothetical protein [Bacteroidota bacterium]